MPVRVKKKSASTSRAPLASKRTLATSLPFGLPQPPPGTPQKPAGISLCMIVKNEERFLESCLKSISGVVDEMIIVDTGSTDRTVEIAQSFGARVEHRPWKNDFGWARNEAVDLARFRWIIQLDADEELTPDSREPLRSLRETPAYLTGVWLRCLNETDQYIGSGFLSHAITRIFPNHPRIRYRGAIHEFATLDGRDIGIDAQLSTIKIIHKGYLKDIVGERDKAVRNLDIIKRQCEEHPTDPFHWFNYGMTNYIVGDYPAAVEGFERMRELNPPETARGYIPNALAALADCYTEKLHQPEKGVEIAQQCLELAPNYANAHFALGKAYFALREFDKAREAYLAAIDDRAYVDKQFVVDDEVCEWKSHSEIGSTYVEQGDNEKAVEWFDLGIKNRRAQPIRLNRARALERLGRFTEASQEFLSLYEEFGDDQSMLNYLNYLLRRGLNSQALAFVDAHVSTMSRDNALDVLMAAAAVMKQANLGDGESYLRRALDIHPGFGEALNALEAIYRARGDDAALNGLWETELRAAPERPGDYARRAFRHIACAEYEQASIAADAGLEFAPDDGLLLYNGAVAKSNIGQRATALNLLEKITPVNEDVFAQGSLLRAVLLREEGRIAESLEVVEGLLSARPGTIDAIFMKAQMLEGRGELDAAEAALKAAWQLDKHRIAVELAGLYLRQGRVQDAQRTAALALAP